MSVRRNNVLKKVVVALSGGVDSAVSLGLLLQAGYQVEALFMKNWEEEDTETTCGAAEDLADAQAVCRHFEVPLHTVNFAAEYWDQVFETCLHAYEAGYTPNPDILCNRYIKFEQCRRYALENLHADRLATGHYAELQRTTSGVLALYRGQDSSKDQSYFLSQVSSQQLENVLFPVGALYKREVRTLAEQWGLPVAQKKDSTGLCFIGERRFTAFLKRFLPLQPGPIVDSSGRVVGEHTGLMYYTLGQRAGLGIGGRSEAEEAPWYVIEKQLSENKLVVAQGNNHPALFASQLEATELHWIGDAPMEEQFSCTAQVRYRQTPCAAKVEQLDQRRVRVLFETPVRAITPGQAVVLYDGRRCLGGATIVDVHRS